ncbi:MerR family transcriptional regulator [Streptomyces thermocarboxydovorans]|uniref:MerR family transcriptional regulator n=1 Tax=Streptomyces thermocarboxydovorans TaxID=59298 RepID=UPI0031E0E921
MSIGALAERFGLATHVLRHWEAMGLLTPVRDAAGRRRYGSADLTRVAVILRAKEAGLSLRSIRSLTAAGDPARRRDILSAEAEALRSRIAAAQASLDLIECALGCDHDGRWSARAGVAHSGDRAAGRSRGRRDAGFRAGVRR